MGSSLARIEFLADSTFLKRKLEFNRLNSVNRRSLSSTRDTINVSGFVFWINIPVISTHVSIVFCGIFSDLVLQ